MAGATMRAVLMDGFGGPEVLRLGEAPRDVGLGARVGAHAGDDDAPQRMVGLTVTAPVESVTHGLA